MYITEKSRKSYSKYGNKKTRYNGRVYDSKKEANRAMEIDLMIRSGDVKSVEVQPSFPIVVNGKKICTYKADFKITYSDGDVVIEDVKGMRTDVYKIKKRLVEALYGINILET